MVQIIDKGNICSELAEMGQELTDLQKDCLSLCRKFYLKCIDLALLLWENDGFSAIDIGGESAGSLEVDK